MITDLDGDGDNDILVAGQRSKNVVWFENPKINFVNNSKFYLQGNSDKTQLIGIRDHIF